MPDRDYILAGHFSLIRIVVELELWVIFYLHAMSFYSPSRNIFDHVSYRHDFPEEFMCDVW